MTTEILPYTYDGREIRTVVVDGEPWFVAVDVCRELDIRNVADAVSSLDDDEKGVATTDTLGGAQRVSIVNEPGLYSLILRSRKPEAKAFKRWITHEVIPSVRRTGGYLAPQHDLDEIEVAERYLATLKAKRELEARNAELEPKAAHFDDWIEHGSLVDLTSFAKTYGLPARKIFPILRDELGVLRRDKTSHPCAAPGARRYRNEPTKAWERSIVMRPVRIECGCLIPVPHLDPQAQADLLDHLRHHDYLDESEVD